MGSQPPPWAPFSCLSTRKEAPLAPPPPLLEHQTRPGLLSSPPSPSLAASSLGWVPGGLPLQCKPAPLSSPPLVLWKPRGNGRGSSQALATRPGVCHDAPQAPLDLHQAAAPLPKCQVSFDASPAPHWDAHEWPFCSKRDGLPSWRKMFSLQESCCYRASRGPIVPKCPGNVGNTKDGSHVLAPPPPGQRARLGIPCSLPFLHMS